MREIKFRAWHRIQKKMYSCDELVADQLTLLADGRFINVDSTDVKMSQIDLMGIMVPLQFTGLRDKNGKEIYEGDICRLSEVGIQDMADPDPFMHIIKWDDKRGGFNHFRIDGNEGGSGWTFCQEGIGTYYEVIGNVWEHPDLLPDAQKRGE